MNWREDKTLIILIGGIVWFTIFVMIVVYTRSEDVQLYALFSGAFGAFLGALMMHLRGEKVPPPGSITSTNSAQVVKVPPNDDSQSAGG